MDKNKLTMKKILSIILISFLLIGCKEEPKGEIYKGEFVFLTDAAVLQTESDIYAVIINDKMHELDEQVKKYKKEVTDMVPVEIRGIKTPKPENEEGWEYRIEVTEIINVFEPNTETNSVIKIGQ